MLIAALEPHADVRSVLPFDAAGVPGRGVVVTLCDGSVFQVTLTRTRTEDAAD